MRVLIESESTSGQAVIAKGEICRVGRSAPSEFVCADDTFLSGSHFAIDCSGAQCQLRDLTSRNGTFLNGSRITEAILEEGDRISAGQTHFRVRIEKEALSRPVLPVLDPSELGEPQKALLKTVLQAPESLLALLDAARDNRILELLHSSSEKFQSLYEGQQGQELDSWAPYLVALPKESRLLVDLLHEGWGKSWGVYLTCGKPFQEIRKHFRHFLLVRTEDRQELYFRFYDPRVLRSFLPVCTLEESTSFWGPVDRYILEGERSEVLQFALDSDRVAQEIIGIALNGAY